MISASRVFFTILFILKVGTVYSQCPTNVKALVNGMIIDGVYDKSQEGLTILICGEIISAMKGCRNSVWGRNYRFKRFIDTTRID